MPISAPGPGPSRSAQSGRAESSSAVAAVRVVVDAPEVAAALTSAREATAALRWHEAMRRRGAECAAESRVRGAHASAELEGAILPLSAVRDRMRGATSWNASDPVEQVAAGAAAATAEVPRIESMLPTALPQVLARLHVAAMSGFGEQESAGRLREAGEVCQEFTEFGAAPPPHEVAGRLTLLAELIAAGYASGTQQSLPAGAVAALAHAEIVVLRPFARGNGVVARALERAIVGSSGLDATAIAVPEVGYARLGPVSYQGALSGYALGSAAGVRLWVTHASDALVVGAQEGAALADQVRAGSLAR